MKLLHTSDWHLGRMLYNRKRYDGYDAFLNWPAELQQDGKLIGVISHVATLKERIGKQISIIPESGGRSMLSSPGFAKIEGQVNG